MALNETTNTDFLNSWLDYRIDYKYLIWNINGAKEKKILSLKKMKQFIICSQETHIRKKDIKYLIHKNLDE